MTDLPIANCNGVAHRSHDDMFALTLGMVEPIGPQWRAEQFAAVMMTREMTMALRDELTTLLRRTSI